jgi:putative MFS transporter
VIGSAGALLAWYLRRGLVESPRWLEARGRRDEAARIVSGIEEQVERETTHALPSPEPLPLADSDRLPFRELWQAPYGGRTLMLIFFQLPQTVGFYGFANWAPTFLLKQGNAIGQSLRYGFLIALVSPVGPLLAVLTARRFERKHALVALALLVAVSGLGSPAPRKRGPSSPSEPR